MSLKVYADRMSQPARAVLIFCKMNQIEFEEILVDFIKRQTSSPEFAEINPMRQVPAIAHGDFKLFESHAILIYLACAFPGVADHWYPADLRKRATIHAVLDWHHSNLRRGEVTLIQNTALASALGKHPKPHVVPEAQELLSASLETIETIFLTGNGPFLLGNSQPSIADLSMVCEIMQLELLDEKYFDQILGPHKKIQQWIEDTKHATKPHFEEVHEVLFKTKAELQKQRMLGAPNPA